MIIMQQPMINFSVFATTYILMVSCRQNFLRIKIYFDELNMEKITYSEYYLVRILMKRVAVTIIVIVLKLDYTVTDKHKHNDAYTCYNSIRKVVYASAVSSRIKFRDYGAS